MTSAMLNDDDQPYTVETLLAQYESAAPPLAENPPAAYVNGGTRGASSELLACAHLMRTGHHVFRCESPNSPFDLVAHKDGKLTRVEVKSVNWTDERRRSGGALGFAWPKNDDWDLLIVVDDTEMRIATTTNHDQDAGVREVRGQLGSPQVLPHHHLRLANEGFWRPAS